MGIAETETTLFKRLQQSRKYIKQKENKKELNIQKQKQKKTKNLNL